MTKEAQEALKLTTLKHAKTTGLATLGAGILYILTQVLNLTGIASNKAEIPKEQIEKIQEISKTSENVKTILEQMSEIKSDIKAVQTSVNLINTEQECQKIKIQMIEKQLDELNSKKFKGGTYDKK